MKDLKNFINESQSVNESKVDKLNVTNDFPDRVLIQPGYDNTQNMFGILLCVPDSYDHIKGSSREIASKAKQLGFKVPETFEDWAESAGVTPMDDEEYTLFVQSGQNEAYWAEVGSMDDGVQVVTNIK